MASFPQTIEEVVKELESEIAEQDEESEEMNDYVKRMLEWFKELRGLKDDNLAALQNATVALNRMMQRNDTPKMSGADRHRYNRYRRLIGNIEELIELETPKEDLPKKQRTRGTNKRRGK